MEDAERDADMRGPFERGFEGGTALAVAAICGHEAFAAAVARLPQGGVQAEAAKAAAVCLAGHGSVDLIRAAARIIVGGRSVMFAVDDFVSILAQKGDVDRVVAGIAAMQAAGDRHPLTGAACLELARRGVGVMRAVEAAGGAWNMRDPERGLEAAGVAGDVGLAHSLIHRLTNEDMTNDNMAVDRARVMPARVNAAYKMMVVGAAQAGHVAFLRVIRAAYANDPALRIACREIDAIVAAAANGHAEVVKQLAGWGAVVTAPVCVAAASRSHYPLVYWALETYQVAITPELWAYIANHHSGPQLLEARGLVANERMAHAAVQRGLGAAIKYIKRVAPGAITSAVLQEALLSGGVVFNIIADAGDARPLPDDHALFTPEICRAAMLAALQKGMNSVQTVYSSVGNRALSPAAMALAERGYENPGLSIDSELYIEYARRAERQAA